MAVQCARRAPPAEPSISAKLRSGRGKCGPARFQACDGRALAHRAAARVRGTSSTISGAGLADQYAKAGRDKRHPSLAGTCLSAATAYATLYGRSPVGLKYTAGLDADTVQVLQTAAWETVRAYAQR